ncbi:GAF and ANTAR domain-containing protein [Nocardioides anomalus]|uniref:GAF and ANTAR domain-containing protein n=1 Tax=Nocardioides anomalus TaxID=2712223 RepID=A0A6G6WAG5_9ACTN|nr:GAF and ANTAR domain-containing protein [Nocardioides anomalus]QIG42095.1 GAF and ANTAR domain-containing protein [Nocardioides anomalus]
MPDEPSDPLEPVAATADAFRFLAFDDRPELEDHVRTLAARVQAVVPQTVGVSLSLAEPQVTFTMAVSDRRLLALDGVQYLEDGPALAAIRHARPLEVPDAAALDEERWSLFARASAHRGVRSTLSAPVHVGDAVVGGLTVYASTVGAFSGRTEELAALVQAPASEVIRDADLSFSSRRQAEETLRTIENQAIVDIASGVLAERSGVQVDEASERLRSAATQAGIPVTELARLIIDLHDEE